MLTGRRAFAGEDTSETLAAVIKDDPDWGALPQSTPSAIRRLLRRCLAKDPKARAADASIARIEIDDALTSPDRDVFAARTSRRAERLAWVAALALVAAAGIAATVWALRPAPPPGEIRVEINPPPTIEPLFSQISPDGQKIVFVNWVEGRARLELRTLDSAIAVPLAGTEDASGPFWSPDSQSIGFFNQRGNTLWRTDIDGRLLKVVTKVPGRGSGGTWNRDDTILFGSNPGLFRVSANGGEPTQVTQGQFHASSDLSSGRSPLPFLHCGSSSRRRVRWSARRIGPKAAARCRYNPCVCVRPSAVRASGNTVCPGLRSSQPGPERQSVSSGGTGGMASRPPRRSLCILHRHGHLSQWVGGTTLFTAAVGLVRSVGQQVGRGR